MRLKDLGKIEQPLFDPDVVKKAKEGKEFQIPYFLTTLMLPRDKYEDIFIVDIEKTDNMLEEKGGNWGRFKAKDL